MTDQKRRSRTLSDRSSLPGGERRCEGVGPGTHPLLIALALSFLALLAFGYSTHDHVFKAGNDASRFAHIESLGEYGEPHIDRSRYSWTVDSVEIDGRLYSNKPPPMNIAGAALYRLGRSFFGWSFETGEAAVVKLLTLIMVGLPTALLVGLFYLSLGLYAGISLTARLLTSTALAAGTILTSFSVTMNNHTVAAALLFAAFIASIRGRPWLGGLLTGLTVCVDIVPGLGMAPALLWISRDLGGNRKGLRWLGGMVAGGLLLPAANMATVASPLTPKLVPGALDNSSSFSSTVGAVLLPERWTYPLECLFTGHGLFSVSPVLLFGALGILYACRSRPAGRGKSGATGTSPPSFSIPPRWTRPVLFCIVIQILGHITLVGSYGGWSYGFRYLIPVIPILLFYVPPILGGWRTAAFALTLLPSILFSLIGAYHPWPPAYEQEANKHPVASMVTNPVGANAAAWLEQHAPDAGLTRRMAAWFIDPDPLRQDRYFLYFFASKNDLEQAGKYPLPRGPHAGP